MTCKFIFYNLAFSCKDHNGLTASLKTAVNLVSVSNDGLKPFKPSVI